MLNQRAIIAEALLEIVEQARCGGPVIKVGIMTGGSELGTEEVLRGARAAREQRPGIAVVAVGPRIPGFDDLEWIETGDNEVEMVRALEAALREGHISSAVAMHYPFPVGVATIGRILTPGRGKPMFIASCTGATAMQRTESMLRNTVYGVAVAKAAGIPSPTVGFLNLDGSGQVLRGIARLVEQGYPLLFGASERKDGGALLRGNDVVAGSVDVLVCDTLTGNTLIKIFSSYSTGGFYESQGWGYGPSVGEGWDKVISIISRSSGSPVIAGALAMTARLAENNLPALVAAEIAAAKKAGLDAVIEELKPKTATGETVVKPPVVPVDAEINGVDVLDMENAAQALWKAGIYAETAMGCTGPVVRIAAMKKEEALRVLHTAGYLTVEAGSGPNDC